MFIDSSYRVGNFLVIKSRSNGGGDFDWRKAVYSPMISSRDLPLPADVLGYMAIIDSRSRVVAIADVVISALLCRPNASGLGLRGIVLMKSM